MKQETNQNKPYQLGLALSGGGAKGFAHIGVFRYLEENGIKPDIIVGTSAGSLMGSLFADGINSHEIEKMFRNKEFSHFAQWQLPKSGLFDTKRFRYFLHDQYHSKRIEDLETPMIVVATDLDNGESVGFKSGPLVDSVTASCSIPIIFTPVIIDGVHYVDGGLFHNFPVSFIREECERVIGVNVSPLIPQKYKQTIFHIAERSYQFMFQANSLEDRGLCDVLIETESFGQYKTFDLDNVAQIVNIGYQAAADAFDKIIKENKDEFLIQMLTQKAG